MRGELAFDDWCAAIGEASPPSPGGRPTPSRGFRRHVVGHRRRGPAPGRRCARVEAPVALLSNASTRLEDDLAAPASPTASTRSSARPTSGRQARAGGLPGRRADRSASRRALPVRRRPRRQRRRRRRRRHAGRLFEAAALKAVRRHRPAATTRVDDLRPRHDSTRTSWAPRRRGLTASARPTAGHRRRSMRASGADRRDAARRRPTPVAMRRSPPRGPTPWRRTAGPGDRASAPPRGSPASRPPRPRPGARPGGRRGDEPAAVLGEVGLARLDRRRPGRARVLAGAAGPRPGARHAAVRPLTAWAATPASLGRGLARRRWARTTPGDHRRRRRARAGPGIGCGASAGGSPSVAGPALLAVRA